MLIDEAADIDDDLFAHRNAPLMGGGTEMRRQYDVVEFQQCRFDLRFALVDVKPGTGDFVLRQQPRQSGLIDYFTRAVLTTNAWGFRSFNRSSLSR